MAVYSEVGGKFRNPASTATRNLAENAAHNSAIVFELVFSRRFDKLVFSMQHTNSSATALTVLAEGSLDNGTTYSNLATRTVTGGASTLNDLEAESFTVSADADLILEYDVRGYERIKLTVTATSGTTSDKLYAQATAYMEQ